MVQTPLRILFISGYFPPHAPIGAVRPGKLAEYWKDSGHDVRIIAIALPSQRKAGDTAPDAHVHYVDYYEPGRVVTTLKSAIKHSSIGRFLPDRGGGLRPRSTLAHPSEGDRGSVKKLGFADVYRQALLLPDRYRSWIKPAVRLALSWQSHWMPDVIYSSGPPNSGHIVAERVASRLGVRWIAELRDLWIDNPYFDQHWLIKPAHDRLAKATLARATAWVVVTQEARERLGASGKPIVLSYNGYDPKDFEGLEIVEPLDREHLTVLHAGVIYPGRRDPSPLFKAISTLGRQAQKIRCLFYAEATGSVAAFAEQYGVRECVEIRGEVPRSQILRLERQADILLECRWQDSAGDGVIPGKLFEYIGARRPILSLGSLTGEAAKIVRDSKAGLASNDPDEIKTMLLECLAVKARLGRVPDIVTSADDRFRRETQFQKIDDLIEHARAASPRRATRNRK